MKTAIFLVTVTLPLREIVFLLLERENDVLYLSHHYISDDCGPLIGRVPCLPSPLYLGGAPTSSLPFFPQCPVKYSSRNGHVHLLFAGDVAEHCV